MCYAYILKSLKDGGFYKGSTANLVNRIKAHNAGKFRSTKSRRPLELYYYEEFDSMYDARTREMFFKSINGYIWLKNQKIKGS